MELSISDDDLCATCKELVYRPGERSLCNVGFPAAFDEDGYATDCLRYDQIDFAGQNWAEDITNRPLGSRQILPDNVPPEVRDRYMEGM